jgi:hypothetical protein
MAPLYSPSPMFKLFVAAAAIVVGMLILTGCAATPPEKPAAVAPVKDGVEVISILKIDQCDKAVAYFAVTNNGVIHAVSAKELSKDQIEGIETDMQALPEGNAGQLDLPCLPTDQT